MHPHSPRAPRPRPLREPPPRRSALHDRASSTARIGAAGSAVWSAQPRALAQVSRGPSGSVRGGPFQRDMACGVARGGASARAAWVGRGDAAQPGAVRPGPHGRRRGGPRDAAAVRPRSVRPASAAPARPAGAVCAPRDMLWLGTVGPAQAAASGSSQCGSSQCGSRQCGSRQRGSERRGSERRGSGRRGSGRRGSGQRVMADSEPRRGGRRGAGRRKRPQKRWPDLVGIGLAQGSTGSRARLTPARLRPVRLRQVWLTPAQAGTAPVQALAQAWAGLPPIPFVKEWTR